MTTVFVYGTLKRGYGNWGALLKDRSVFLGEAVSVGANYIMLNGGFPRVLDSANGHPIFGELFEVDRAVLKRLDRLEGHPHWYRRCRRKFRTADGSKHQAWVYIMQPERTLMAFARVKPVRGTLAWHYQESRGTNDPQ
jgi:gamma-glutamylcyclotransferase (GGCT)/AIG2-like uncharacterized protein YtfP